MIPRSLMLVAPGLVLLSVLLVGQEVAVASLEEYARAATSRQAMGVYMMKKKVGWGVADLAIGKLEGRPCLVETFEMRMEISMFGETTRMETVSRIWYGFEGEGPILRIEERHDEDGQITEKEAFPTEEGFVIVTRTGENERRRQTSRPKANLSRTRDLDRWLDSGPVKGAKFEAWSVDLEDRDIDSRDETVYLGKRSLLVGGVPTEVIEVQMDYEGMKATAQLLAPGIFLKVTVGGGAIEMRAEDERTVRDLGSAPHDVTWTFSIPVEKDLGDDPALLDSLSLRVENLGEVALPQNHRQQVKRGEDGSVSVRLLRDHRIPEARPLPAEDRTRWSDPEPGIESDDAKLRKFAAEIAGDEKDPVKVAGKLQNWVFENLEGTGARNASSALAILESRAGDCTEHARLFVALARARGIPAREITGLLYARFGKPMFAWHAWAEIHDGHQWVSVDPAWDQVYVDAGHLRCSEGEGYEWLNVMGAVRIAIEAFEKR